MFYTSKDVTIKTNLLSWPYDHTMDAKIDNREPHIPLGQDNRHLLSFIRCVGPACPRFHVYHFFSLSPGHDYLVSPMQRGNRGQGAFSQVGRLLWTSATGLSPGSLPICLSAIPSSLISATILKAQKVGVNSYQKGYNLAFSTCGCGCFGRKGNLTLGLSKPINQMFSSFLQISLVIKSIGPWGLSHMALLGKSICWVISVRSLTHIWHLLF